MLMIMNLKKYWAKNYKIPFRSNIKLMKNKILADQSNSVFY